MLYIVVSYERNYITFLLNFVIYNVIILLNLFSNIIIVFIRYLDCIVLSSRSSLVYALKFLTTCHKFIEKKVKFLLLQALVGITVCNCKYMQDSAKRSSLYHETFQSFSIDSNKRLDRLATTGQCLTSTRDKISGPLRNTLQETIKFLLFLVQLGPVS